MKNKRNELEIASGIYHFDTGPFNWYIIEENEELTLVDAGFPGHYNVFKKGLKTLGFKIEDLKAIILTHAHSDHVGFANRLKKETGVPIYIHTDDKKMAGRILQLPWYGLLSNAWRPYILKMLLTAIWNGILRIPTIKEVITFNDGDVLNVPGKPLVIHMPGHTNGSCSFYIKDRKVLFSGDNLVAQNTMQGKDGDPQIMHPLLNKDFKEAHKSLDLLKNLGEVIMLSGHGKPWIGNLKIAVELASNDIYLDKCPCDT
jgi:glyoxylase-like metal-dependent hydrolase (beta-lactamase superfamily II)